MTATRVGAPDRDPLEARIATRASGLVREFNQAGVLSVADVHVARRLTEIAGERDEAVMLAVALAVRAPRLGHVHVDLARIRDTAAVDGEEPVDVGALPWPEASTWVQLVAGSPLVVVEAGEAEGEAAPTVAPLRLTGSWLYLDRYWAEEVEVARALLAMASEPAPAVDARRLADGVQRLFGADPAGRQALSAQAAVLRRFAVVAGGPGTGKTTTVARIVALLYEQAPTDSRPLIALAAPTGKAAARLQEAVHAEAATLDVDPALRSELLALQATTLHRLLGRRPGTDSRFRHDRHQRLPHDAVIVDETSMVSLSMMARLIEALRSNARLVLVGDPGQLASIEAGAVLGDIVGPAADPRRADAQVVSRGIDEGIVVLERVHRFGGGIAQLATAIHEGDAEATISLLRDPPEGVSWIEADVADEAAANALGPVREEALRAATKLVASAERGATAPALESLAAFRILCAHRRGPYGVSGWTARMENWLAEEIPGFSAAERWYAGRPLLAIENDYELRLYNGDTGVVMRRGDDRLVAAFPRGEEIVEYSPARLGPVETVYAMTIHKSQGSQFEGAAVLLPEPGSRILTRELLYTAVTRARRRLIVVGTEEALRTGVQRPVARASGLRSRLWTR